MSNKRTSWKPTVIRPAFLSHWLPRPRTVANALAAIVGLSLIAASDTGNAQPIITSFSPGSARVGSSVTLSGNNFGLATNDNIVYFGAVRAIVTAATNDSLTVTVPTGAIYAPITVTANGLTAYSAIPFVPIFPSDRVLNSLSFGARIDVPVEGSRDMLIVDMDGDGRPDIVSLENTSQSHLSVRRNLSPPGTLSAASFASEFFVDSTATGVAVGDFDGDGKFDLAIGHYYSHRVSLFRNTSIPGAIAFTPAGDTESIPSAQRMAVADLDLDGKPDLLITSGTNLGLLRNVSAGTNLAFGSPVYFTLGWLPTHLAVGDLDRDGKSDVITAEFYGQAVSVLRNTTTGGAIDASSLASIVNFPTEYDPLAGAVGDLDGDGKLDLIIANNGNTFGTTLSVLRNVSTPGNITTNSFAPKVNFTAGESPYSLAIGDLDGDGKVEMATANGRSSTVSIFKNSAVSGVVNTNSFAAALNLPSPSGPSYVRIADLDGDGKPEILVNAYDLGVLSIFPNAVGETRFTRAPNLPLNAAGCSWGDYDNDGDLDVFLAVFGGNNALYRNDGNGSFTAISSGPVVIDGGESYSGAWGDYDNDGWLDLFVANEQIDFLYRNNRDGTFSSVTNVITLSDTGSTYSAAWGDYDNDGWIDLFVANRNDQSRLLFRNNRDGTFTNVTTASLPSGPGVAAGSAWADYDNDGWLDLFVAAVGTNSLYRNNRDGTFARITSGDILDSGNSEACVWGDYDNDGFPDLFLSRSAGQNNALFHNNRDGTFTKIVSGSIVNDGGSSIGASWADYDKDGWLDLFVANNLGENNLLYRNNGDGTFTKVTTGAIVNDGGFSSSAAWGDYDNDGDPDLLVCNQNNEGLFLYRTDGNSNRWLTVQCAGLTSNRSGIGAKVRVSAIINGVMRSQYRTISGDSFGSQNGLRAAFGLGDATIVDTVRVEWPSRKVTELRNVPVNQSLTVTEPAEVYIAAHGNGYVTSSPLTNQYLVGQTLTLTATPRTNWWRFLRWADGNTNSSRTITIAVSNVFTAIFTNTVPLEELVLKQWEASFGGSEEDNASSIRQTSDGAYVVAGHSMSGISGNKATANNGGWDSWVVKLDAKGNKVWERSFGGTHDDYSTSLALIPDGGCVLAGPSRSPSGSNKTSPGYGGYDFWVVRLNRDGDKLWENSFGGTGEEDVYSIETTADGGFILGGYTESSGISGNKTSPDFGSSDFWVVRIDANGNKLWDKSFGGLGGEILYAMAPDADGGYLLGGYSTSGISGNKTASSYGGDDFWIVRLDANGNKLWDRSYGGNLGDRVGSIAPVGDGGFMLAGGSSSGVSGTKTAANYGVDDYWVLKIDRGGEVVWDKSFGGDAQEFLLKIIPRYDGTFVVGGSSFSDISGTKTSANRGGNNADYWIVQIDSFGTERVQQSFGGNLQDYLFSLAPTSAGYALAGYSWSPVSGNKTSTNYGVGDFWIVNLALREGPIGIPVLLVNGQYSPSNHFVIPATNSIEVSLQTTFPGGVIFYSLSANQEPDTEYTGPFPVTQTTTIRALAYTSDFAASSPEMNAVTITVVPVYILSTSTAGGGGIVLTPPGGRYLSGVDVQLTATNLPGWTFLGWSGDASGTNPITLTMNGDRVVQAAFGTTLTTSVVPPSSGSIQRQPAQALYPYGQKVRLTAYPAAGRYFTNWTGAASNYTGSSIDFEITNATPAISARFNALPANTFALTVERIGNGTVTNAPNQLFYGNGQTVTLTATPGPGSGFVGWTGAVTNAINPLTLLIDASKTIIANFSDRVPAISSFAPASGPVGTVVTIVGTNFNSTPAENIVYFGPVRALVSGGSPTSLSVTVPPGATCEPITVTTLGRTGYAKTPFIVTFSSTRIINSSSFSEPIRFPMLTLPRAPISGDFDSDGKPDIATANPEISLLTILRNTSAPGLIDSDSFTHAADYPPHGSPWTYGLARGDLTGDGKLDIAIPTYSNDLFIYRNRGSNGAIAFNSSHQIRLPPGSPVWVAIADLDLDGRPELIVPGAGQGHLHVFQNTTATGAIDDCSFGERVTFPVPGSAPHVAIGDLDVDGKPDLAVAVGDRIAVLRNSTVRGVIDGNSFAPAVDFPVVVAAAAIAIADIDGDGKPELIAANHYAEFLSVFRNTATPGSISASSFAPRVDFPAQSKGWVSATGDLNGDGKLDLVVANYTGVGLSVFRNTSTAGIIDSNSFAPRIDFATSAGVASVAIGDIDLDGRPDLIACDDALTTNSLFILRNLIPSGVDPAITITSPTDGAIFAAPANVAIETSLTESSGSVTQVVFYANDSPIGSATSSPFSFSWNNVPNGSYALKAVATDSAGRMTNSPTVNITVIPPANQPPLVSILSPTNGALFLAGSNIPITISAADPDGSIASVAVFFAETNLLATFSNSPFSLTWSNAPVGPQLLTARAMDNLGASAFDSRSVIVKEPDAPPEFRFEHATYVVNEGDPSVTLRVVRNFTGFATVNFATGDDSANAGADYVAAAGQLQFQSADTFQTVSVTLREDLVVEGDHRFTVGLSFASAGMLANPSQAMITITDNDVQTTNSFLSIVPPTPVDESSLGSLRVFLTGGGGLGQWRLPWERIWRASGGTAAGLPSGEYEIQFKPISGYQPPPFQVVAVRPMQETRSTNNYTQLFSTPPGSLTVFIEPYDVATNPDGNCRGQWQRDGEGVWHDSGETVAGLPADNYLIHFRALPNNCGWGPPADRYATVLPGVSNTLRVAYYWNVAGASTPEALDFSEIQGSFSAGLPYAFNGQIVTEYGEASGFVVKERVVLTAAHVVFDDYRLTYLPNVRWLFQRHPNNYNPSPQVARGYYVLAGYAAQRQAENTPGVSTRASFDLDVAALYFYEPAGRNGYGGYIVSESPSPQWLQTNTTKVLVGYPVEGILDENRGKIHAIRPRTMSFAQISNTVFVTTQIRSFPGNSGGPLCVLSANGYYYPAGVYLGGSGNAIVRAIDARAVELINLAELAANVGTNNTGGGVIRITPFVGGVSGLCTGYVTVTLNPPAAYVAGAAWRVAPRYAAYGTLTAWTTSTVARASLQNGPFELEFRSARGFFQPALSELTFSCNTRSNLIFHYVQLLPRLDLLAGRHLVITGDTNSQYRVEFSPDPGSASSWSLFTNFTLPVDRATAVISNVLASSNRFYRAVWLP